MYEKGSWTYRSKGNILAYPGNNPMNKEHQYCACIVINNEHPYFCSTSTPNPVCLVRLLMLAGWCLISLHGIFAKSPSISKCKKGVGAWHSPISTPGLGWLTTTAFPGMVILGELIALWGVRLTGWSSGRGVKLESSGRLNVLYSLHRTNWSLDDTLIITFEHCPPLYITQSYGRRSQLGVEAVLVRAAAQI